MKKILLLNVIILISLFSCKQLPSKSTKIPLGELLKRNELSEVIKTEFDSKYFKDIVGTWKYKNEDGKILVVKFIKNVIHIKKVNSYTDMIQGNFCYEQSGKECTVKSENKIDFYELEALYEGEEIRGLFVDEKTKETNHILIKYEDILKRNKLICQIVSSGIKFRNAGEKSKKINVPSKFVLKKI